MTESWKQRVEAYCDRLEATASAIDELLDESRLGTVNVVPEQVSSSQAELAGAVGRLEDLVGERDVLLRAEDAPADGLTLTEKLLSSRRIEDARLAKRCRQLAERLETTHHRALSLFVCQFHLADFGKDLLQLLSGTPNGGGYGEGEPRRGNGGGLFDEAA